MELISCLTNEDFALESKSKSLRRNIIGHINEVWIFLEELMPERMKHYGAMTVSDEELLRNPISKLISFTNEIISSSKINNKVR
jgi:hypothetical protein